MAEGGGDNENEARRKMQEASAKLFQKRQEGSHVLDTDSGRIAMPSLSNKWQTIIDDTVIPQIQSQHSDTTVKKRSSSISPDDRKARPLSMPSALSPLPLELYNDDVENQEQARGPLDVNVVDESSRKARPPARLTPLGNDLPPPPSYAEVTGEQERSVTPSFPHYGRLWQIGRQSIKKANDRPVLPIEAKEPRGFSESRAFTGAKPLPPIGYGDRAERNMRIFVRETEFSVNEEPEKRRSSFNLAVDTGQRDTFDIEEGRTTTEEPEDDSWFAERFPRVARYLKSLTFQKILILVTVVTVIIGLIIFLGVFPASFVYVEYYEMALLKNKVTGTVYRDEVYHTGCYVLGPDKEFVRYPVNANTISETTDVFTRDRLEISMSYHLQYYIRSVELGDLHREYEKEYDSVLRKVIASEIKNNIGHFNLDYFRLSRPNLEKHIFKIIKDRLDGNCCQSCCPGNCVNNTACVTCLPPSTCNPGYHVDIKYFQLAGIVIPNQVSDLFIQKLVLQVEAEKEYLLQEHTIVNKETEQLTHSLRNEANEILEEAKAVADKTVSVAEADKEANLTSAYVYSLNYLYLTLGVNNQDHKLSLMMMRVLEDLNVKGNLYRGYGYNTSTIMCSL